MSDKLEERARERLAAWMIENSFATGHGDTFEDLLRELTWQVAEIRAAKKLAIESRLILRCQAVHPEVGQCELRAGHKFEKHLAGMILWPVSAGSDLARELKVGTAAGRSEEGRGNDVN